MPPRSSAIPRAADKSSRLDFIRIAAAATISGGDNTDEALQREEEKVGVTDGKGDSKQEFPATPLHRSRVSVLEVALSNRKTGSDDPSEDRGLNVVADIPTLSTVCFVDVSEGVAACALCPGGTRLAVSFSGGRVATWVLPVISPFPKQLTPSKGIVGESTPSPAEISKEVGEEERNDTDCAGRNEGATLTGEMGRSSPIWRGGPPKKLRQPEFCIPHLPSLEEKAYNKAMQEYNRRFEGGDLEKVPAADDGDPLSNRPPAPPLPSALAYHLAHVDFLPAIEKSSGGGNGGGAGGLAVWRSRSNVWRLYRMPSCLPEPDVAAGVSSLLESDLLDAGAKLQAASTVTADGGTDPAEGGDDSLIPTSDISSLPSSEWILPSPITSCAVCDADNNAASKSFFTPAVSVDGGRGVTRLVDEGGWSSTISAAFSPLVALGTQNGGVYLCNSALGLRREGLSRHRARVTAMAFHGRRCGTPQRRVRHKNRRILPFLSDVARSYFMFRVPITTPSAPTMNLGSIERCVSTRDQDVHPPHPLGTASNGILPRGRGTLRRDYSSRAPNADFLPYNRLIGRFLF